MSSGLDWLLIAVGFVGFIVGAFGFVAVFLRMKARVRWQWTIVGGLGAVGLLCLIVHFLVLDYPKGLLRHLVKLP